MIDPEEAIQQFSSVFIQRYLTDNSAGSLPFLKCSFETALSVTVGSNLVFEVSHD